jgi:hypothetical protein
MRKAILTILLLAACSYQAGEPRPNCSTLQTRKVPLVSKAGDTTWITVTSLVPCDSVKR